MGSYFSIENYLSKNNIDTVYNEKRETYTKNLDNKEKIDAILEKMENITPQQSIDGLDFRHYSDLKKRASELVKQNYKIVEYHAESFIVTYETLIVVNPDNVVQIIEYKTWICSEKVTYKNSWM